MDLVNLDNIKEQVPEETYKLGDIFYCEYVKMLCVLACVNTDSCCNLITIDGGRIGSKMHKVKDLRKITEEELKLIADNYKVVLIKNNDYKYILSTWNGTENEYSKPR
jgi:hypothetical protein